MKNGIKKPYIPLTIGHNLSLPDCELFKELLMLTEQEQELIPKRITTNNKKSADPRYIKVPLDVFLLYTSI